MFSLDTIYLTVPWGTQGEHYLCIYVDGVAELNHIHSW